MTVTRPSVRGLLTHPAVSRLFAPATKGTVTIFVLHRMVSTGVLGDGTDPVLVRAALHRLQTDGYRFVALDELVAAGPQAADLGPRLIALTADDGYDDQARLLAPLVIELGLPLTIFLTTGFVDGQQVNWWDRVSHAIGTTSHRTLDLTVGGQRLILNLSNEALRRDATYAVLARCKTVGDEARLAAIGDIEAAAEVDTPTRPFGPYRPMSWDEARRLEAGGLVSFGPHTVTHPILSKVSDAKVATEVTTSWRRLNDELARPVPVFCYPNGEAADFGRREVDVVRQAGLVAAVTVDRRPATLPDLSNDDRRFYLGRVPFPDSVAKVVQRASGLDHLRHRLGGRRA